MTNLMRLTSLATTAAALALTATPALAANPDKDATARARILRPLTLTWVEDFDLGTIVLSGPAGFTTTVSLAQDGTLTCDATKVTCSGATSVAVYNVRGTNNQDVSISAPDVTLTNSTGDTLTLAVDAPATVTLSSSGSPGDDFSIGGSIDLADTTPDGVYSGTFAVTADYQ